MSRPQVSIDRLTPRRATVEPREAMNCKSCRKRKVSYHTTLNQASAGLNRSGITYLFFSRSNAIVCAPAARPARSSNAPAFMVSAHPRISRPRMARITNHRPLFRSLPQTQSRKSAAQKQTCSRPSSSASMGWKRDSKTRKIPSPPPPRTNSNPTISRLDRRRAPVATPSMPPRSTLTPRPTRDRRCHPLCRKVPTPFRD